MSVSAERRRKSSVQRLFQIERGDAHGLAHLEYRLVAAAAGEGDAGRRVVLVKLVLPSGSRTIVSVSTSSRNRDSSWPVMVVLR